MRFLASALVGCAFVFAAVRVASADCGDRPGDAEAVAATRAAADVHCDCATAARHGTYVECIAGVADDEMRAGRLRRRCRAAVVRCAARSTCGRLGAVACCVEPGGAPTGVFKCAIRSSTAQCTPLPHRGACLSDRPSCCDACTSGTCTPVTTSTTPGSACTGDAACDDGNACTEDRCVDGGCEHVCRCLGSTGLVSCCPGPGALCPRPAWYNTCGDPACGGHRDHPGIPPCGPGETPGTACSPEGKTCDPGSFCNQLLRCATSDPTHGGMCPISRARYKKDVRYLGPEDVRRLHDELMKFPLATYRYKGDACREHLGFIIEDVEPSLSVDAPDDIVDLYGYTSMAVAALQVQARQLAALEREVAALKRELARRRAQ
ncbi:MAG TPA: tail fiber domain-containing protein [Candidatus Binatus sp.]|nr:tail fiber domain-containing protein [Candidatus Binatus sp.]